MEVLRTPDAAFDGLVDWPYPPAYYTSTLFGADVRIAFYDLCGGRHADAAETVSALAAPCHTSITSLVPGQLGYPEPGSPPLPPSTPPLAR